jgi:hypothetical protein
MHIIVLDDMHTQHPSLPSHCRGGSDLADFINVDIVGNDNLQNRATRVRRHLADSGKRGVFYN